LWRERLWWMIPILIALILVALLVVLGSNPAVAPFVYVLF
jgi:membrane glycosyltransferase